MSRRPATAWAKPFCQNGGTGSADRWKPASASGGASLVEESVRGAIPGPRRQAGGVTIGLPGAGYQSRPWGGCQQFGGVDIL